MVSLPFFLTTLLFFFIQLNVSLHIHPNTNPKQYTLYYQSYHYKHNFLTPNENDNNIISIDNLNITINSLINITINHSIHLDFFNDTHWNKILQIKQTPNIESNYSHHNRHLLSAGKYYECPGNDIHCHSQSDGLLHCDVGYSSACTSPLTRHCKLPCHNPRYALSPVSMSWSEGVSYCLQHYGAIASIMSPYENQLASTVCPWHCWIGLKETSATTYINWHNGKKIGYTNWYPGEPNNDNRHGKDCGELYHEHNGLWNDIPCHRKRLVLCEHGRAQLIGNYIAVQTPKTYIDADNYCLQKYGTHLATLHSYWDNRQAKKACDAVGLIGSKNEECWIGLKGPFNKWADGVYAQGFLKFSNWYDKLEGNDKTRWRMILRLKDISKGYFKRSIRTDGLENPTNDEANTYSIIGQLNPDSYKNKIDGKYEFKLVFKDKSNGYETEIIWKQTSWIDSPSIDGFEPISMPGQTSSQCGMFSGLGKSDSGCSYLDGNGQYKGCWFNSVGTICSWRGGIPSYNWRVAKAETLYIYAPKGATDLCGVIHSDGKWYDKFCSQKKHFVCNAMSYAERLNPYVRHGLERAAYDKHYREWTGAKQLEHMKRVMKKNMEKDEETDMMSDPYKQQEQMQLKQKQEVNKQKWNDLRSKLEKQGVFKQYMQQGYFSPFNLNRVYGNDMRLSFPVHWWRGRRLIDNEYDSGEYYKCVLMGGNGMLYDMCVGFGGIEVMKYLFYKKKDVYVNGGDDLMEIENWKYKYILDDNDSKNGMMVYKFDSDIYNEIEYKMSYILKSDEKICLNGYICLKIMNDSDIEIEMIKIKNFDSLMFNFLNDDEWDEIVNKKK
eukprot:36419_1